MSAGDTIVAPATPFGYSGIAVVRISGPEAFSILSSLTGGRNFSARRATVSDIKDKCGTTIDRCVITKFSSPSSYTGEDVVEISSHGNPFLVEDIIRISCDFGARPAEAGEFTRRAFLNGKLDLVQVEAVSSLIHSKSSENSRCQQKILHGSLSKILKKIRSDLIDLLGSFEYQMDFSEEVVSSEENKHFSAAIENLLKTVIKLKDSFYLGRLLNRGATVVIAGEPNVGKSTLLNRLAGSERAIVSTVPGTTRDTVEVELLLCGVPVLFVDTAGLRSPKDIIERAGVKRTLNILDRADLIISLTDNPKGKHINHKTKPVIRVLNKSDLNIEKSPEDGIIHISSLKSLGVGKLKKAVSYSLGINKISTDATYLSTTRQHSAIKTCFKALFKALDIAGSQVVDVELLSFELRVALDAIDAILGKTTADDILNHVFRSLCVGK